MPLLSWERGTDEKELTSRWSLRLRVEQGGRCALSRPTNIFEKKSSCAIASSPFFISCFSCDVPLRQLFMYTVHWNQMLWVLGTSSTATLFWTSCGKLGGQGLGVELAEQLAEEDAEEELLCELGRERARNLTTDLFAYLRPSFQVSSNCNLSGGTDQHITWWGTSARRLSSTIQSRRPPSAPTSYIGLRARWPAKRQWRLHIWWPNCWAN